MDDIGSNVIYLQEKKKRKNWVKYIAHLAAAIIILSIRLHKDNGIFHNHYGNFQCTGLVCMHLEIGIWNPCICGTGAIFLFLKNTLYVSSNFF